MKHDNPPLSRRNALLTGLSALTLSACDSIIPGQGPPPRLYRLTPKSSFAGELPRVDWQLVIEAPTAQASIDTPRIGLMLTSLRFDYYAQANWVDRAPLMVQALIVESFDNSHAIVAVGRESIGLRPDYVLKTELREFQAELIDGRHLVNVAINAKLVQMPERQIVASAAFQSELPAPPNELNPVISAFDTALGKVLKDIVKWTLLEGERAEAARAKTLDAPGPLPSRPARTASSANGGTKPQRRSAPKPKVTFPRLKRPS